MTRRLIILWTSLLWLTALPWIGQSSAQTPTGIYSGDTSKGEMVFAVNHSGCRFCNRVLSLVYTEAFRQLGYKFSYTLYPLKRSLMESNSGRIGGETARMKFTPGIKKTYPNLIQVEETIWESVVSVYSDNPDISIDGWDSLKNYAYLGIGYRRGNLFAEMMLKQKGFSPKHLIETTDVKQGLRMLASGRIGIFLDADAVIEGTLRENEFRGSTIEKACTLDRLPLYPYLHKKYANLVPALGSVLKQMKEDKTFDRFIKQAQDEVFSGARAITLATGHWPPFTGKDLKSYGTAADIVSRAFALEDYKVSFVFWPWMRGFKSAQAGQVDGSILWRRTREREKSFYFSDPVISVNVVLFHLKSMPFNWKTIQDLERYRSGVVNGLKYQDEFDAKVNSGELLAETVTSQEINFMKLLKGRVDYTPVILENGYATLKSMFSPETVDMFTHHPVPLARHKLYLILSRKVRGNQQVISDFNQGLFRLNKADR